MTNEITFPQCLSAPDTERSVTSSVHNPTAKHLPDGIRGRVGEQEEAQS